MLLLQSFLALPIFNVFSLSLLTFRRSDLARVFAVVLGAACSVLSHIILDLFFFPLTFLCVVIHTTDEMTLVCFHIFIVYVRSRESQ